MLKEQKRLQQEIQQTKRQHQLHRQQLQQQRRQELEQQQLQQLPNAALRGFHPTIGNDPTVDPADEDAKIVLMGPAGPDYFPPLLKRVSWTKLAPFKEERFHRAVSDSIANNFSPFAAHLNVQLVGKRPISQTKNIAGGGI